jgi:hypothetical protein
VNRYRETLNLWAAQHIPDNAIVTKVDIDYDDGYDPTFTDRPESLTVLVEYTVPGSALSYGTYVDQVSVLSSLGELLTELFRIEDEEMAK